MREDDDKSIFIGARPLSKEEVKSIVPTYDALCDRIEDIRREAKNVDKKYITTNKKYNNTLALFGNRGTGKTSTMYTLIEKLKKDKENIILDILEPDNIGPEGKIIGCILGLFKQELDNLKREIEENPCILPFEIKNQFFSDCRFKESNPLQKIYNDLIEAYCYTEKDYRTLLTNSYTDMNSYVKKTSYIFNADMEFSKKFAQFINEFVKVKKSLINGCLNEKNEKEPLIFIFIDDVDLNTSKCHEIIEAILKYAAHPNIVCFVSGDYDTFTEAFTVSLLKKENLSVANINLTEHIIEKRPILQSKQVLAYEYMKKVFPNAYRHYVNYWDLALKPTYKFSNKNKIEEKQKTLYGLLKSLLEISSKLYNPNSDVCKIENIFGFEKESDEENPEYFYPAYNMFDITSRGLVNVYLILDRLHRTDYVKISSYNNEEPTSLFFVDVKNLIDVIIDSSNLLSPHKNDILQNYILWSSTEEQSKIDFYQLNLLIQPMADNSSMLYNKRTKYSLFYLCYFITLLLPNIQHIKEERKNSLKFSLYILINDQDLSEVYPYNPNISQVCPAVLYIPNISYKHFIFALLSENNLGVSQNIYKFFFDSEFLLSTFSNINIYNNEFGLNSSYIKFYEFLKVRKKKKNINLNSIKDFILSKTYETDDTTYVSIIFYSIFDNFISNSFGNSYNTLHTGIYNFFRIMKLAFKNACTENSKPILISSENLTFYLGELLKNYKDNLHINSPSDLSTTSNLLYNIHNKHLENENTYLNIDTTIQSSIYSSFSRHFINQILTRYNNYSNLMIDISSSTEKLQTLFAVDTSDSTIKIHIENLKTKLFSRFNSFTEMGTSSHEDNEMPIKIINLDLYFNVVDDLKKLLYAHKIQSIDIKDILNNLITSLENDFKIEFTSSPLKEEKFFTDDEKWAIRAYSLFIQQSRPEILDLTKLQEAKIYIKQLIESNREKQNKSENAIYERLKIDSDEE
ncbi:hypothetical protein [Clostridium cellulovorans]|uniref:Uncharacterized protein n=1 Tax=Clostridium cellulovorans (strain ATCC 35296 / DSM 3052 / OCM 3 / 743B) TaxID=573061 RepID=D9SPN4_CLOC7|nr:hypothetical protein [Clostridium cellulovorans]ADL50083.1 hypothetical protein Clocel_0303 [Clostridium cellulovorans 743B]